MPQIAQQDYLRLTNPEGLDVDQNYSILGALLGAVEKGTIFDVIIDDEEIDVITKVLSVVGKDTFYITGDDGSPFGISANDYTRQQYEGLGFIQQAEFDSEGSWYTPELAISAENLIVDVDGGVILTNEDGYAWKGVEADGRLASFELSETKPEHTAIVVPFDIMQKFIGIALS